VASARIITDQSSGQSKGFGFVEMPSASEAQAAITGLHGKAFLGRTQGMATRVGPTHGSGHAARSAVAPPGSTTEGGKEMRMIIGSTALVFVCVFSVFGDVQALSPENMAAVVQVNFLPGL
jgi:hypothetical protein